MSSDDELARRVALSDLATLPESSVPYKIVGKITAYNARNDADGTFTIDIVDHNNANKVTLSCADTVVEVGNIVECVIDLSAGKTDVIDALVLYKLSDNFDLSRYAQYLDVARNNPFFQPHL